MRRHFELTKRPVELAGLSRWRGELMGLAMIFVMLFHVSMPKSNPMFGLVRCGNVGVDIFLLLSGVGLWFSWSKQPSVKSFFKRRFLRIYPAWLLIASLHYIPQYLNAPGGGYSPDVFQLALNILVGWSFWRVDDLTFWYVPAIMVMYAFAPFYMKLIRKHPEYRWLVAAAMAFCVMVQYYPPVHRAVGHVEIFWSRIPIFLIGINMGAWVKERKKLDGSAIWLILLLFVMSLAMCIEFEQHWRGRFPLFLERMVYIPLTVCGCMTLTLLLEKTPEAVRRFLRFVGTISLEIYLIHIQFVLVYIRPWKLGYCLTFLLMTLASLPLAWVLHKAVEALETKIMSKEPRTSDFQTKR